jgi:DNA gyrase/topoisomerase IV subunit B
LRLEGVKVLLRTHPTQRGEEMAQTDPNNEAMKQALKEALAETLHEQRELLHEIFAEVLEDFALTEAIREGRQTERIERAEVFDVLEGRS